MKFIKLSIFALTMGLFIASCGNGEATEEGTADSVENVEPIVETAPEAAPVDTTMAPQADTTVAPATEEAAH